MLLSATVWWASWAVRRLGAWSELQRLLGLAELKNLRPRSAVVCLDLQRGSWMSSPLQANAESWADKVCGGRH